MKFVIEILQTHLNKASKNSSLVFVIKFLKKLKLHETQKKKKNILILSQHVKTTKVTVAISVQLSVGS